MAESVCEYKGEGLYTTCEKERVVRCRECLYYSENGTGLYECAKFFTSEYSLDDLTPFVPLADGFCAWGERLDDD